MVEKRVKDSTEEKFHAGLDDAGPDILKFRAVSEGVNVAVTRFAF